MMTFYMKMTNVPGIFRVLYTISVLKQPSILFSQRHVLELNHRTVLMQHFESLRSIFADTVDIRHSYEKHPFFPKPAKQGGTDWGAFFIEITGNPDFFRCDGLKLPICGELKLTNTVNLLGGLPAAG